MATKAVVAEWLRRLTRNQIPSGSVGSNPTDCDRVNSFFISSFFSLLASLHLKLPFSRPFSANRAGCSFQRISQQCSPTTSQQARLAQSVEHETLNLRVVGSSPTLGAPIFFLPFFLTLFLLVCPFLFLPLTLSSDLLYSAMRQDLFKASNSPFLGRTWRRGLVG